MRFCNMMPMSMNKSVPYDRQVNTWIVFSYVYMGSLRHRDFQMQCFFLGTWWGRGTQITHAFVETSYHARFVVTLDERQKYEIPRNIVAHVMDFYH